MSTTETQVKKEKSLDYKVDSEKVGEVIVEAAAKKGKVKVKLEKYMYVGPPTRELPKYAIFEGGMPSAAKKHFEKCPALKALFIDPKELTNFQMKLADSNSVESMFYKKADEYFSEVKE